MRLPVRHIVTAVGLCLIVSLSCSLERTDPTPLVSIAVFGQDLPSGTVVDPTMLLSVDFPAEFVTGSWVRSDSIHYVFGHQLMTTGQRGDPLMWQFFEPSWTARLLNRILAGQLEIFELRDVAQVGALCPRQHVNVVQKRRNLLTHEVSIKTVLENVFLLDSELFSCGEFTRQQSAMIAVPVELVGELEHAVANSREGLPLALSGYEPLPSTRATRITCGWSFATSTRRSIAPRPPDEARRLTLDVIRRIGEVQDP